MHADRAGGQRERARVSTQEPGALARAPHSAATTTHAQVARTRTRAQRPTQAPPQKKIRASEQLRNAQPAHPTVQADHTPPRGADHMHETGRAAKAARSHADRPNRPRPRAEPAPACVTGGDDHASQKQRPAAAQAARRAPTPRPPALRTEPRAAQPPSLQRAKRNERKAPQPPPPDSPPPARREPKRANTGRRRPQAADHRASVGHRGTSRDEQ